MKEINLKIKNKNLFSSILKEIYNIHNCYSVTLVGSFANKFNYNTISDIDIVVISKQLDKKFFNKANNVIYRFSDDLLRISKYKKILINNNFGPLKYDNKNTLVIHLMMYDLKEHKEHVLNSPFTCFDWERSNFYIGKKLKNIYPVERLFLNDFYKSRRGIINYYNDIIENKISFSKIQFSKNSYRLKKMTFNINNKEKYLFLYHIFTNLIKNLLKFEENKKINFSSSKINKKFILITSNYSMFDNIVLNNKKKFIKSINLNTDLNKLCLTFLNLFNKYLNIYSLSSKVIFKRHLRTKYKKNIFLGSGSNPEIKKNNVIKEKNLNFDYIYSSPLKRSVMTANIYKSKLDKIIKTDLLKEIDYGKFELHSFDQVKKISPSFAKNLSQGNDPRFPKGENTKDVLKRVLIFLKKIQKQSNENKLSLVVTHNVFLRCLIGHYFNKP